MILFFWGSLTIHSLLLSSQEAQSPQTQTFPDSLMFLYSLTSKWSLITKTKLVASFFVCLFLKPAFQMYSNYCLIHPAGSFPCCTLLLWQHQLCLLFVLFYAELAVSVNFHITLKSFAQLEGLIWILFNSCFLVLLLTLNCSGEDGSFFSTMMHAPQEDWSPQWVKSCNLPLKHEYIIISFPKAM